MKNDFRLFAEEINKKISTDPSINEGGDFTIDLDMNKPHKTEDERQSLPVMFADKDTEEPDVEAEHEPSMIVTQLPPAKLSEAEIRPIADDKLYKQVKKLFGYFSAYKKDGNKAMTSGMKSEILKLLKKEGFTTSLDRIFSHFGQPLKESKSISESKMTPQIRKQLQQASKAMKQSEAETLKQWNDKNPHFGNSGGHRYDGSEKECSYCLRPKDWTNIDESIVKDLKEASDNDKTKRLYGLLIDAINAMNGRVKGNDRAERIVSVLNKNMEIPSQLKGVVSKYMKKIGTGDESVLMQQLKNFRDEVHSFLTSGGIDESQDVALSESESDYKAVKAEVIDSFTNKEMEKFKNFNEFFAEVDVQNAYEEEWEEGQHTYKPHYKRVYDEFKKGKLKMNESKKRFIKEEEEEEQEGSREDFYSEQIKGDMVAKAWIKFAKTELNEPMNTSEPSWASVQKYDWNRFGWEMSKVMNKFRMGDKMPDGTEDRMWYRLFLATQGHKDYRTILRSPDGPAYKLKIRQMEKATLDALMNETRKITNSKTLSEAKSVSKNVTQFGLANNMKKSKLRLVPSMAQPNIVVPEKYMNRVVREMGEMLGSKCIKNIGRTMYFEVPKWDSTDEKVVAQEIVDFLGAEDFLKESILNRNRSRFLRENNQNKFIPKGSYFLKEAKGFDEEAYQKWLKASEILAKATKEASDELNKIAGNNKGGLTPDSVKSSKEFKDAKQKFDRAFKDERDLNKSTPKEFMKKKVTDRRNKWSQKESTSLRESVDTKEIEAKIDSAYKKDGKGLNKHDFDYEVEKDGSFYIKFDYTRSRMKGHYSVDKNYMSLKYYFVDEDGLDYNESYRVKGLDDALSFIMNHG